MKYIILLLMTFSMGVQANNLNLSIPTSPQNYSSDQFRSGTMDCRQAIGSSTQMEFGVMGVLEQDDPFQSSMAVDPTATINNSGDFIKDIGVYARIVIPIGAPKERIDCNRFFKLEMKKREMEILKLQQEISNLRRLNFEDK